MLVPRIYGAAHFDKPPMIYWMMDASYHAFGINEFAARMPSAASAFGVILLVWYLGVRFYGPLGGFSAALILLTSPLFFVAARLADLNMLHTLWITLALAGYFVWQQNGNKMARWIFYLALGLSLFTKGPVGPVVTGLSIFGFRLARGRKALRPIMYIPGLLLMCVVGLWWYILAAMRYPELWSFFIQKELLGRYLSQTHGRVQPAWYYFWILPLAVFPWVPSIAAFFRDRLKHICRNASDAYLLAWVVLPVIFFSLSGSKLPTYILPLLPALALIAARQMVCLMPEKPPLFTGLQSGFVVFFAVAVPLGFWLYGIQTYHWTRPVAPQYIPAVLFAAAVVYAMIRFSGIYRLTASVTLLLASYFYMNALLWSHESEMGGHGTFKAIAQTINKCSPAHQPVALYRNKFQGVSFYLDRPVIFCTAKFPLEIQEDVWTLRETAYQTKEEFLEWVRSGLDVVYITRAQRETELRAASTGPLRSIYCADDALVLQPVPLQMSAGSRH
ncbi:MAG: glycosyltransferase family 39 protein [Kiritimatiellae bacterium]|nr:glycosyltransferase family 39 protein [Kiritimatiellia bacterium]